MGAYLSQPITEKVSNDAEHSGLMFGDSSMQGWRISQEDAHNCIGAYDNNTSFFAVYDGHGGAEVALYCSKYLPDFIKQSPLYKEGKIEEALQRGFIAFDETLTNEDVIKELKALSDRDDCKSESEECEEIEELQKEAEMPLDKLLARFQGDGPLRGKQPASPFLRAKKTNEAASCSSGSSSSGSKADLDCGSSRLTQNNGTACTTEEVSTKQTALKKENDAESSSSCAEEKKGSSNECKPLTNGSLHEEEATSGKEKSDKKKVTTKSTRILRKEHRKPMVMEDDDESDDDSEDLTFAISGSDTESEIAEEAEEECEAEDEEDEECDEEDCGDEEECIEGGPVFHMKEQPGNDSGCTAVIAVLRETKVIVANAGDSRCVVCRESKAMDMSHDHKPEDDSEFARITNAGGTVTSEGRVNGGLNLSRAIGDHAYKQNTKLSLEEQMISALPDVKSLELDWSKDEFMVLACDGIWNSMSSQEVVDFVRQRIHKKEVKMSTICEQLFDRCLASSTIGDGTGCDNMTCIIVKFPYTGKVKDDEEDQVTGSKRQASPLPVEGKKKAKLESAPSDCS